MSASPEDRELHSIARRLAKEGGDIAMRWFGTIDGAAESKGLTEIVTEADVAVEAHIVESLRRLTPEIGVLGEESGRSGALSNEKLWVIDPIDGTTNFAHGVPYFGVCIGLWDGEARISALFNPATDELWSTDGQHAWLNDRQLPALRGKPMNACLMGSGFPYDRQITEDDNTREWRAVMKRCRGVRRMGAAAVDLAYVAAGRLDGFWEPRLKPWDVVAGAALVRAVGGIVTDFHGRPWNIDGPDLSIVAGAPEIHAQTLQILQEVRL